MGKRVLKDCFISIDGNDLSANAAKVEIDDTFEAVDMTTFGSGGAKEVAGGLEDGGVNVTWKNDYAAGALDATMWPLRGQVVAWEIRASQAARGADNPSYLGNLLVNGWKPLSGSPGDAAEVQSSFPASGVKSRQTS